MKHTLLAVLVLLTLSSPGMANERRPFEMPGWLIAEASDEVFEGCGKLLDQCLVKILERCQGSLCMLPIRDDQERCKIDYAYCLGGEASFHHLWELD